MFKLNEKYEINRDILKCDYIRYSPSEISTINTTNSQVYINIVARGRVLKKVYYLLSYAGSTLGQHCCMVATANIYKSRWYALLNRANKGIA